MTPYHQDEGDAVSLMQAHIISCQKKNVCVESSLLLSARSDDRSGGKPLSTDTLPTTLLARETWGRIYSTLMSTGWLTPNSQHVIELADCYALNHSACLQQSSCISSPNPNP